MSENNNNNNSEIGKESVDKLVQRFETYLTTTDCMDTSNPPPANDPISTSQPEKPTAKPEELHTSQPESPKKPRESRKKASSDLDEDSDSDNLASDSEEEQILRKRLVKRKRFVESEAEEEAEEIDFTELDRELKEHYSSKKQGPSDKKTRCAVDGCVLLAVKDRKYCSGCGRSRREKKARALRRDKRRLLEQEYELRHKYERLYIREQLKKQQKMLANREKAIKKHFKK